MQLAGLNFRQTDKKAGEYGNVARLETAWEEMRIQTIALGCRISLFAIFFSPKSMLASNSLYLYTACLCIHWGSIPGPTLDT